MMKALVDGARTRRREPSVGVVLNELPDNYLLTPILRYRDKDAATWSTKYRRRWSCRDARLTPIGCRSPPRALSKI